MRRRLLKVLGVLAVLAVMAWTLRDRVPAPEQVLDALRSANTGWLLVAAAAEFVSMGLFARQQRRLLTAFGVTMPRHRALALSYSRSAMAISLPAGSAVSAAYAFREFRADGADRAAATAVMVLSGLLSAAGLALLYVSGVLTSVVVDLAYAWNTHPALTALGVLAVTGAVGWIAWALIGAHRGRVRPARRHLRSFARWPWLAMLVEPVSDALVTSRTVAPRHWLLALAAAVGNWLTDMLCLFAAARAFDIELSVFHLATIYITVQLVRQVPLTPGGIGVIEVGLLAGLVSAGAAQSTAAAAVLSYRLLSCWLIIPVGLLGWLVLRARRSAVVSAQRRSHEAGHSRPTRSQQSPAQPDPPDPGTPHALPPARPADRSTARCA